MYDNPMGTIGVIVISVLGGMFALAVLIGLILLLYLAWRLLQLLKQSQEQNQAVSHETKSVLESAKSGFSSIRNETRTLLEEHRRQFGEILELHRKEMQQGIDKINAEALQAAAARSIEACMRLEKAVGIFQKLLLDNEERVTHEYGAEDTAPESSTFGGPPSGYSLSQTARLDAEAEQQEAQFLSEPGLG